jgi:hypothetical protein
MRYWLSFNVLTFVCGAIASWYAPENIVVVAGAWLVGAVVSAIVYSAN